MISVVVATFNGEDYVLAQLESLYNQTIPVDEVIISDDKSTDATCVIVEDFINEKNLGDKWELIKRDKNLGYSNNFMQTITLTKGDYIFMSDQDDVWNEDKIELMVKEMQKNPDINMLSCRVELVNSELQKYKGKRKVPHVKFDEDVQFEKISMESMLVCSFIRGCTVCIRKDVVDKLNFDLSVGVLGHDYYIAVIAASFGKIFFYNRRLMKYRIHDSNTSMKGFDKEQRRIDYLLSFRNDMNNIRPYLLNCSDWLEKFDDFFDFINNRIEAFESNSFIKVLSLIKYYKYYAIYGSGYIGGGLHIYFSDLAHYISYKKYISKE